jgi:hypothetical protein
MSTPLSVTPPQKRLAQPPSTPEITANLQRMIDLQNKQIQYSTSSHFAPSETVKNEYNPPEPIENDNQASSYCTANRTARSMESTSGTTDNVGQGTLLWRNRSDEKAEEEFFSSASLEQISILTADHQQSNDSVPFSRSRNHLHNLSSYGAVDDELDPDDPSNHPPPPPPPQPSQHQQQTPPYYQDPHAKVAEQVGEVIRRHDQQHKHRFRIGRFVSQCWNRFFLSRESLHRSFCYGSIDGMLTGAGIVSTFCGMNLLSISSNNPPQIRALVVAFTAATCFADAVCMALSHIWTTHVLAASQHREREMARLQLQTSKAEAKGMLVDMLLHRGMLKIDAMSLADTLEGYPDLFVAAVIGDALANAPTIQSIPPTPLLGGPQHGSETTPYGYEPSTGNHQQQQHWRSYGRLTDLERIMDPDSASIHSATLESRKESFFMMLGFSLFAVVPSLIYTWVPAILLGSHDNDPTINVSHMPINPNALVICLTSCVMAVLGVWKSRFLDSNWLLFGIETVLVLWVCIACAYGVGALLNKIFLPDNYLLQVAKTETTKVETIATAAIVASSSSSSGKSYHHTMIDPYNF